ncbi:hypothetical protein WJX73_005496 [Symbiochloris irregularis]|uniref:CLASP N-terminal domain-containing protein n=1 Tax=Symbiochloris irregularis TaxID=706552 RepID=A0AAW1PMF6_9CHLO
MQELKRLCLKDSHVVCIGEAIGCIGDLASGLRSAFISHAREWVPLLLDKLRDQNLAVFANAVSGLKTLLWICRCMPLADAAGDITASLEHESAKQRLVTLKVLQAIVESSSKPRVVRAAPQLLQTVAKLYAVPSNAPNPLIHEAALRTLVAFALNMGYSPLSTQVTAQLDKFRRRHFEELLQQEGSKRARSSSTSGPSSTPASGAPAVAGRPSATVPHAANKIAHLVAHEDTPASVRQSFRDSPSSLPFSPVEADSQACADVIMQDALKERTPDITPGKTMLYHAAHPAELYMVRPRNARTLSRVDRPHHIMLKVLAFLGAPSGSLQILQALRNLEALCLGRCPANQAADIASIAAMRSLRVLDLRNTPVEFAILGQLRIATVLITHFVCQSERSVIPEAQRAVDTERMSLFDAFHSAPSQEEGTQARTINLRQ